ncbi:MAG TPA: twin-arginine translocase subunit TatC [Planctomycetaceae bacterium]|nr:twin-arginine translocase subunit TatC [Planctomycetaceae bacterium]
MAPEIGLVRADLVDLQVWESTRINAQALKVEEVFMVWLKAALISALVLASPWIFYQIWTFVAAGLYPHEKRYIHLYLPMSLVLFLSGVLLAFFGVFQPVLMFLFQFNASMGIDPQPRIGEWLTFVMVLPLGFGIAFQLPLVMLFLNRIGLFTVQAYLEKWRVAILVIFVVAMILTPADPISMLLLAIPLSFLYFGGILLCRWLPRNRNPFAEAYEP